MKLNATKGRRVQKRLRLGYRRTSRAILQEALNCYRQKVGAKALRLFQMLGREKERSVSTKKKRRPIDNPKGQVRF
jgi:hypothetical protein